VIRVGASAPVPVDLRVVAATHRDPAAAVRAGTLREDFVARVRGFVLELPPLARRMPDLGLLVAALLARLAGDRAAAVELDVEAARALVAHAWPQNIRELERALETALALAGCGPILPRHLKLEAPAPAEAPDDPMRSELLALLAQHQGNVTAVAAAIGKKRQQIQKWLKKYGIDPDRYR
jgi:transcriptional regulator of acetoin/glycerol metabolism